MTAQVSFRPAANLSKSDFTLTKIKTFKGMEGMGGFNATLLYKGQVIAEVINDDSGGPTMLHYVAARSAAPSESRKENEKLVNDFCATQPPMICSWIDEKTGKPAEIKYCDEFLINDLMDAYEEEKEKKRSAARRIKDAKNGFLFRLKSDSNPELEYRTIGTAKKPCTREQAIAYLNKKYGNDWEAV